MAGLNAVEVEESKRFVGDVSLITYLALNLFVLFRNVLSGLPYIASKIILIYPPAVGSTLGSVCLVVQIASLTKLVCQS
jgi:hypothetical protein